MAKKIARVFVRKTQYTPEDNLVFFDRPGLFPPEIDEVHVSCLFTWDKPKAERLAQQWSRVAPVKIGGPAYENCGSGSREFIPGMYLRPGYTITSRGCIRKCPFCFVYNQEGPIKEFSIHPGSWLMDNNLLACSEGHIRKVFSMLRKQKGQVKLLGGLDIRLLKSWHVELISQLKLLNVSIAYDMPNVEDALVEGLYILHDGGISHGVIRCFVLAGFFDWDTPQKAEERCRFVLKYGATPCAMFYRGPDEIRERKPKEWSKWAVRWAWQPGIYAMAKRENIPTYQEK